jgi:hypothetical protein
VARGQTRKDSRWSSGTYRLGVSSSCQPTDLIVSLLPTLSFLEFSLADFSVYRGNPQPRLVLWELTRVWTCWATAGGSTTHLISMTVFDPERDHGLWSTLPHLPRDHTKNFFSLQYLKFWSVLYVPRGTALYVSIKRSRGWVLVEINVFHQNCQAAEKKYEDRGVHERNHVAPTVKSS